jgi:hypothetical protein
VTIRVGMELELDGAEEAADGTSELTEKLAGLEAQTDSTSKKVDELGGELRTASQRQGDFEKQASKAVGMLGSFANSLKAATHAAGAQNTALGQAIDKFSDIAGAAGAGAAAFGPFGAAAMGSVAAVTALVDHLREEEEAHLAAARAIREQTTNLDRLMEMSGNDDRMLRLSTGLGTAAEQTDALSMAQARLDAEGERIRLTQERHAEAVERLNAAEDALSSMRARTDQASALALVRSRYEAVRTEVNGLNADLTGFNVSLETQRANVIELAGALFTAQNRERDVGEERERTERRQAGHGRAQADRARAAREAAEAAYRAMELLKQKTDEQAAAELAAARAREANLGSLQTALDAMDIARREAEEQERRDVVAQLQEEIASQAASLEAFRAHIGARTNATEDETADFAEELLTREATLQAHVTALAEIHASSDRVTAQSARMRVEENELANQAILENTLETERRARAQRQELAEISVGMVEDSTKAIAKTFVAIAKGEKSVDEAFQGLLASFLEMLGEMAGLQAAKEYALAIGDFASQNYSGGALHLAAGVAWTVVAVAAGAGAAAVAPAAASTPSSPEPQTAGGGGGGGGTTIVNFNGAFITATTEAEVGRQVSRTVEAGQRRFG